METQRPERHPAIAGRCDDATMDGLDLTTARQRQVDGAAAADRAAAWILVARPGPVLGVGPRRRLVGFWAPEQGADRRAAPGGWFPVDLLRPGTHKVTVIRGKTPALTAVSADWWPRTMRSSSWSTQTPAPPSISRPLTTAPTWSPGRWHVKGGPIISTDVDLRVGGAGYKTRGRVRPGIYPYSNRVYASSTRCMVGDPRTPTEYDAASLHHTNPSTTTYVFHIALYPSRTLPRMWEALGQLIRERREALALDQADSQPS